MISCEADTGSIVVGAADSFAVAACDGVWDVMSSEEVAAKVGLMLDGGQDHKSILSAIITECFEKDTKDNMTIALVTF